MLHEDDWPGWVDFTSRGGGRVQIVGDVFFATTSARLTRGVFDRLANAVLIKPNQAGTVTRAERTEQQLAKRSDYATVASARSGKTEVSWLADLAVGWSAGQIKVGSTMRSERTAKWTCPGNRGRRWQSGSLCRPGRPRGIGIVMPCGRVVFCRRHGMHSVRT